MIKFHWHTKKDMQPCRECVLDPKLWVTSDDESFLCIRRGL